MSGIEYGFYTEEEVSLDSIDGLAQDNFLPFSYGKDDIRVVVTRRLVFRLTGDWNNQSENLAHLCADIAINTDALSTEFGHVASFIPTNPNLPAYLKFTPVVEDDTEIDTLEKVKLVCLEIFQHLLDRIASVYLNNKGYSYTGVIDTEGDNKSTTLAITVSIEHLRKIYKDQESGLNKLIKTFKKDIRKLQEYVIWGQLTKEGNLVKLECKVPGLLSDKDMDEIEKLLSR